MCRYCSVRTCECKDCPPLRMERELLEKAKEYKEPKVLHTEGRCPVCGHKYWMSVSNF